jgi:TRAP transporter 4TM/12TM fusion protein
MDEQAALWPKPVWLALGAASIAFHLWLIFSGLVPNLVSRPLHMALAVPWIMFAIKGGLISRSLGWALGAGGIAVCIWLATSHRALDDQYGALQGNLQIAASLVVLACVVEMARRAIGWPLPLIAVLAVLYGLFGEHIPGELGHPGLPVESFLGTLVIAEGGLWGQLTGVSVSVVAVFVIFGAVLNAGEAGQGFMNLALASAGRLKAGAAKVSVLASSLFGSISGSASANVASTGSFTLPAMKRLGYPPSFAAAVEAVASSGGQIMPPLMGAGAFVMVELTSTPYTDIMAAAILPALLFFVAVWFGVDGFANRYDLKGMGDEARVPVKTLVVTGLFFMVPFAVLMERLFIGGFTAQYAAALAILTAAVLLLFNASGIAPVQQIRQRFSSAIITAGQQIAMIAAIILCASIIVGVSGPDRPGGEDHLADHRPFWRVAAGCLAADGACLPDPRHGSADHGSLRHLHLGGRAGLAAIGCAVAGGTPVRVLVRAAVDHHAAGVRHSVHRCRHGRCALAAGCRPRHDARRRALPDSAGNDGRPVSDRTGRATADGACCLVACRGGAVSRQLRPHKPLGKAR